jgi:NAD(P)-dependent dehydrogenase (short-subunit alcohol dehydrogenase family)
MRDLAGKTAFVTGGASGIGFALARAFAEVSMNVMLADIETDALSAAVASLSNIGPDVRGVPDGDRGHDGRLPGVLELIAS